MGIGGWPVPCDQEGRKVDAFLNRHANGLLALNVAKMAKVKDDEHDRDWCQNRYNSCKDSKNGN